MTTTTLQSAGYIVCDNEAIHGYGPTADEAWADFMNTMAQANIRVVAEPDEADIDSPGDWTRESDYQIKSASAGLIQRVKDQGGNLAWSYVSGIACTREEEEAAHEAA